MNLRQVIIALGNEKISGGSAYIKLANGLKMAINNKSLIENKELK